MILTPPDTGTDTLDVAEGTAYLLPGDTGAAPRGFAVGSIIARLDGLAGGTGEQRIRPVVLAAGVAYVGTEILIDEGQAAGWRHLVFEQPPAIPARTAFAYGIQAGGNDGVARLLGSTDAGADGYSVAAPYPAAPPAAGTPTDIDFAPAFCALGVEPWTPPAVDDEAIARLPLDVAEAALGASGPTGAAHVGQAGWHYISVDAETSAFAIVRTDGPLADLVGERVRVSADVPGGTRSVVVVIHDEQAFDDGALDEDISLTRRAFSRLAPLWTEALTVRVEVLA